MRVVGVDGFRRGWIAVVLADGRFEEARTFAGLADLLGSYGSAGAISVDVPIGVPDAGVRAADAAARRFVGPRASSVFATPPRAALDAESYAAARAVHPSISAQAYALRERIREADALAAADARVHEVHPEVSFRALARRPLPPKRSWSGVVERRAALAASGIVLPDDVGPAGAAAPDDVLDAAAAAWSAGRLAVGRAEALPPGAAGRIGAIWY